MTANDRPPLSVVVATRDRPALLDECLASLVASLHAGDELIVVDSASRGATAVRDVAAARGAEYLRCELPGASRARNAGWRAAQHDYVAFVDDDTRVRPAWADAIVAAIRQHDEIGFVTGRIDHPDPDNPAERPVAIYDEDDGFVIDARTVEPFGHGANHVVRRAALEVVGGFDERMGAGAEFRAAEDLDLWDRVIGAGWVGRYEPTAVGWHEQWRDRHDDVSLDWGYGFGAGARIAKLLRTNPRRAFRSAAVLFWFWGARSVVTNLRRRKRFVAVLDVMRMFAVVVGFARTVVVPVEGGHFKRRR